MKDDQSPRKSGPALHAATVALTPVRALTSHLRRHYRERYLGRYHRAAAMFAFDLALAVVALALVGVNVWLATLRPPLHQRYALTFTAPSLRLATPTTFVVAIEEKEGRAHHDVRFAWIVPLKTEVLNADPAFAQDNEVLLGDLGAYEKRFVRLSVRLMALAEQARIGFRLRDADGVMAGSETRQITGSGIQTEIISPTVFANHTDSYALLRAENKTNMEIADAEELVEKRDKSLRIGTLRAFESKIVPFLSAPEFVSAPFQQPHLTLTPWQPGNSVVLETASSESFRLMVVHPALRDADRGVRIVDVEKGSQRIVLPVFAETKNVDHWYVIPFVERDGQRVSLGFAEGRVTTSFDVSARVRYYSDNGDQIGVGPWPPRAGETTRLWVTWSLAPTNRDISDVVVQAALPAGVRWTGKSALPNGGSLDFANGEMLWTLPRLPAVDSGANASFEIEYRPPLRPRTKSIFLNKTTASAQQDDLGVPLHSESAALKAQP